MVHNTEPIDWSRRDLSFLLQSNYAPLINSCVASAERFNGTLDELRESRSGRRGNRHVEATYGPTWRQPDLVFHGADPGTPDVDRVRAALHERLSVTAWGSVVLSNGT